MAFDAFLGQLALETEASHMLRALQAQTIQIQLQRHYNLQNSAEDK